jgi:hypothetical protein
MLFGSGPAITAHGSLDLKQENQIQIHVILMTNTHALRRLIAHI